MLPDNQLRKEHLRKLRVFPNEEHPFKDLSADRLVPFEMPLRALKRSDGEDEYRLETESGTTTIQARRRVAKFQSEEEGGVE